MTGRITRIEAQKKSKHRYNIYVDEEFAFGIHESVLLDCQLAVGDELDKEAVEKINRCENLNRAKQKALSLITYRRRSIDECRKRLLQNDFSVQVADQVVDDLKRVGLLDDLAFAEAYVQTRLIQKPVSKRQMAAELKAKGLRETDIQHGLETGYKETSDIEIAETLLLRRMRRYRGEETRAVRKKLTDFLARRGFDWDTVREAVDKTISGEFDNYNEG